MRLQLSVEESTGAFVVLKLYSYFGINIDMRNGVSGEADNVICGKATHGRAFSYRSIRLISIEASLANMEPPTKSAHNILFPSNSTGERWCAISASNPL